jgi:hypothetical protein
MRFLVLASEVLASVLCFLFGRVSDCIYVYVVMPRKFKR